MSVAEMKKKTFEKLQTLSEAQLIELTHFVYSINKVTGKECDLLLHVGSVVAEREEVVKKLAQ
ncbi:MAG: hypothetical protein JWQ40_2682 [Segetibacter sp.]|jgi:hypothetical protein|nr:hypothetical protein [Segetibacter sp.]